MIAGVVSAQQALQKAKRVVIKIGSALLVQDDGQIRQGWLDALADDIAALRLEGKEVVLVSSGAIAVGRTHLGLIAKALKLEEKQAAAATGQIRLAHAYQEALARHQVTVSQVLLTLEDTEERRRHLNARNTIETLLKLGTVPVINENDTVATSEIRFGDNDRLGARVATMVGADVLILLSDIDGLYSADPRKNKDAVFYPLIEAITPDIEDMAGEPLPGYSSGGMVTKIAAGKIATNSGCHMLIASGLDSNPVSGLINGERKASLFLATSEPLAARKNWIAGSLKSSGQVIVDDGAMKALASGRSLLPAGVIRVRGVFRRGDAVVIESTTGKELARGLVAYDVDEAAQICGKRSSEIAAVLGYDGREELIHRDDLVLTGLKN
jgi:glutamate 5-kinase